MRPQKQCGQHGDRRVHGRKTIRRGIEALHEGEKFFGMTTTLIDGAPFVWRGDWKENKKRHLCREQQNVTHGDVHKLPWRFDGEIDVNDDRIIETGINPDPARLIGNGVVERNFERARLGDVIALAPEIELIDAHDEEDAQSEINQII